MPFGQGCVDFVQLFKILKEINYKGAFLIEMWTAKSEDPQQEIIAAREWMLKRMQELILFRS